MDSKILIVIAVAAIVVVGGVAAFMFMGNNDKGESSDSDPGKRVGETVSESDFPNKASRLWVYGNANEDDRIDSSDVSYLEDIISGKKTKTQLADTNADGVVNEADVDYLNAIIKATKDTKLDVYYIDNYFQVQKVSWPVKTIATTYCSGLYTAEATGLTDKIAMVDSTIETYWAKLNSHVAKAKSMGTNEAPDWEGMMKEKISVYVPGYCDGESDKTARSKMVGVDVMFMNTCDNSGVPYPNEYIDRSIVMFGFLLQGDMDQTYDYLKWHDESLQKMENAAKSIQDADKAHFVMSRNSPSYQTGTFSITGKGNTNLIHAEWVGVYALGEHGNSLIPNNYNSLSIEQCLTLLKDGASADNKVYWMDNEHDGLRGQRDLDATVTAWADALKESSVDVHYMGMAREAGNSPLYIVEAAFYQDVMYPDLDNGLDYAEMLDYFIDNFTAEKENYKKYFDTDNFFKDFGVL